MKAVSRPTVQHEQVCAWGNSSQFTLIFFFTFGSRKTHGSAVLFFPTTQSFIFLEHYVMFLCGETRLRCSTGRDIRRWRRRRRPAAPPLVLNQIFFSFSSFRAFSYNIPSGRARIFCFTSETEREKSVLESKATRAVM